MLEELELENLIVALLDLREVLKLRGECDLVFFEVLRILVVVHTDVFVQLKVEELAKLFTEISEIFDKLVVETVDVGDWRKIKVSFFFF